MARTGAMPIRARLLASTAAAVLLLTSAPVYAQSYTFSVPAQSARQAIPAFARQAGVQIIANANDVDTARLNAVTGRHSVAEGLAILLDGTGLEAVGQAPDIIVIRRIAAPEASLPVAEPDAAVIVTAQKRREPLQNVPASVQVVSGSRIDDQATSTFKDIIQLMSGVTVREHSDPRNVGLIVRGVGSNQSFTGIEPDAAVNIDGEVMSRSSVLYNDSNDIDSVAILKGPQGTLFGKNSVAGVLQIKTRRPSLTETGGSLRLMADQGTTELLGQVNSALTWNQVLDRDSAIRLNLFGKRDSGWVKNVTGGPNGGSGSGSGGRLQYLHRFGEDTDLLLRGDYQKSTFGPSTRVYLQRDDFVIGNGFGQIPQTAIDALNLSPSALRDLLTTNLHRLSQTPAGPDNHETSASTTRNYGGTHSLGLSGDLVHRFGGYEIDWSAFYRDETLTSNDDSLATWVNAFPLNFSGPVRSRTYQSELRVTSPIGPHFDYVAGLFYLHSKIHRNQRVLACQDPGLDNSTIDTDGNVISCGGYAFGWGISNPGVTGLDDLIYNREIRNNDLVTDNAAMFAQGNLHFGPRWTLTLGGRLLNEQQRFSLETRNDGQPNIDTRPTLLWIYDAAGNRVDVGGNHIFVANPFYGQVSANPAVNTDIRNPDAPFTRAAKNHHDTAFTYKAALLFRPTPSVMTYVNYSTGYKGVAWFTDSDVNQATLDSHYPIPPETSQNFELGLRAQAFKRRLTINATLFDTTFYHYQDRLMTLDYSVWPIVGGGLQNIANNPAAAGQPIRTYSIVDAGNLSTKGLDLDIDWKVSDHWRVTANYSHVDARFGKTDVLITCSAATRNGADISTCTAPINYGEFFDYTFPRRGQFFSLSGAQLANAPKDTVTADVEYGFSVGGWRGSARWNYRFTSEQYTNHGGKANNDASTTTPAYGLHNLFLGVNAPNGKYRFTLFVKNVFDQPYYVYKTNYGDGLNEQAVGGSLTTVPQLIGIAQAYPTYGATPNGKFFRQRAENGNVLRDFSRYVGATFEMDF